MNGANGSVRIQTTFTDGSHDLNLYNLHERYSHFKAEAKKYNTPFPMEAMWYFRDYDDYVKRSTEARPVFQLSRLLPVMKRFKPINKEWFRFTYVDDELKEEEITDSDVLAYIAEIRLQRYITIVTSDGDEIVVNATTLSNDYEFFDPSTLSLEDSISVPLTTKQVARLLEYEKWRTQQWPSTELILLSEYLPIMNYFQPKDKYWWRDAVVDEGVKVDRKAALHNLGLYARLRDGEEFIVTTTEFSSLATGDFNLRYDPIRNPTIYAGGYDTTYASPLWDKGQWSEEIAQQAVGVEWLNVLYGILKSASLRKKNSGKFVSIISFISWVDIVSFIPLSVTHYGLRKASTAQESLNFIKEEERRRAAMNPLLAAMLGEVSVLVNPSVENLITYQYFQGNMRGLYIDTDVVRVYYPKVMEWNAKRVNEENAYSVILQSGLSSILTKGQRTDSTKLYKSGPLQSAFAAQPESNLRHRNGLLPSRPAKSVRDSNIYEIGALDLVAVINTQVLFRPEGVDWNGTKDLPPSHYPQIAEYMSKTIGTIAMRHIMEILLVYIEEFANDKQALEFVTLLLPYLEGEDTGFIRVPELD